MSSKPDGIELALMQALMNERACIITAMTHRRLNFEDKDADIVCDWMQRRIDDIKKRSGDQMNKFTAVDWFVITIIAWGITYSIKFGDFITGLLIYWLWNLYLMHRSKYKYQLTFIIFVAIINY